MNLINDDAINDDAAQKPRNCGECARFVRNPDCPGYGWCDNWGGVSLTEKYVCHPNFGVKAKKEVRDGE